MKALRLLLAQEKQITIALVGDSTVTESAGWGKALDARFDGSVKVLNFAVFILTDLKTAVPTLAPTSPSRASDRPQPAPHSITTFR